MGFRTAGRVSDAIVPPAHIRPATSLQRLVSRPPPRLPSERPRSAVSATCRRERPGGARHDPGCRLPAAPMRVAQPPRVGPGNEHRPGREIRDPLAAARPRPPAQGDVLLAREPWGRPSPGDVHGCAQGHGPWEGWGSGRPRLGPRLVSGPGGRHQGLRSRMHRRGRDRDARRTSHRERAAAGGADGRQPSGRRPPGPGVVRLGGIHGERSLAAPSPPRVMTTPGWGPTTSRGTPPRTSSFGFGCAPHR